MLRGLAADWPAVAAARRSPEAAVDYLLSFRPTKALAAIVGAPEIEGRFFYDADFTGMNFTRGQTRLDLFLERLIRDQSAERPFSLAVQSEAIPELLPGFVDANRTALLDASVVRGSGSATGFASRRTST
ncbi:MAG: cupin-like domain-containing protein [Sphingomonas sp.]